MRKLKFMLDRDSLNKIYISFVRPTLEYANIVWDNCTQYEANAIEKKKNRGSQDSYWGSQTCLFRYVI